ncbi:hypothetical protein N431DRAFT_471555 [Stipitochalara longipes BDJ]|nr:hypothetical protein N431DRAFT_471555 [Stipitochalara longipes BDJ]
MKFLVQPLRWSSTKSSPPRNTATPSKLPPKKTSYPERLLVYHAGTGRTVFLGCLKVTTIFIFSFFTLVVAPSHFFAEAEPPWVAVGVLLSGVIPMLFVAYISGPFVTYIHLRLPAYARHSREMLMRYTKSLPNDAALDITTMNFIGKPRVARVKVTDLYPVRERFGMANYARDTELINSRLPWYFPKAVRQFGVHSSTGKIMGGEIWNNIASRISRK